MKTTWPSKTKAKLSKLNKFVRKVGQSVANLHLTLMQTHVNMNFKAAGTRSMNFSKDELAAIGKKKLIPERYE